MIRILNFFVELNNFFWLVPQIYLNIFKNNSILNVFFIASEQRIKPFIKSFDISIARRKSNLPSSFYYKDLRTTQLDGRTNELHLVERNIEKSELRIKAITSNDDRLMITSTGRRKKKNNAVFRYRIEQRTFNCYQKKEN